ncbi:MAG: hypothetical protein PHE02_14470 [Lachnospiraceae bacterium]|nr:hypothetical protein [Lachnospiraceae bacterium]
MENELIMLEKLDNLTLLITNYHGMTEQRFEQMDQRFERIEGHLVQLDGRMDETESRLDRMDERFDEMDLEFFAVHQEINNTYQLAVKTSEKVEQIDGRVGRIEGKLDWMIGEQAQIHKIPELTTRMDNVETVVQTHSKEIAALKVLQSGKITQFPQ